MLKLGIIGSDSSHTLGICRAAKNFSNIKITHLYGEDEAQTKSVFKEGGFEQIAIHSEEMIGAVDGVMITCRHGEKHLPYAAPFLKARIPVWIDKPFTKSVPDAKEIVALSKHYDTPVAGGSFVKFAPQVEEIKQELHKVGSIMSGLVCFPIMLNSEYGGVHFYSHHLIETMLTIFGQDVESIETSIVNGNLVAIASYPTFPVIMNYAVQHNDAVAGVFGRNTSRIENLDISGGSHALLEDFIDVINTRKPKIDLNHFVKAVEISNALEMSINEKCKIKLK